MVPWEQVRTEAIASDQVTEDDIAQARAEQDAYVAGYRLAELRTSVRMTQVELAEAMGVSQARVSAMERGEVESLTVASVRAYITALGGSMRIVASLDDLDVTLRLPAA
jgi:DNA-binding transcriptional regulator YiaG